MYGIIIELYISVLRQKLMLRFPPLQFRRPGQCAHHSCAAPLAVRTPQLCGALGSAHTIVVRRHSSTPQSELPLQHAHQSCAAPPQNRRGEKAGGTMRCGRGLRPSAVGGEAPSGSKEMKRPAEPKYQCIEIFRKTCANKCNLVRMVFLLSCALNSLYGVEI